MPRGHFAHALLVHYLNSLSRKLQLSNMNTLGQQLQSVGAVVVPVFQPEELERANRRLYREIDLYPEYRGKNSIETPRVLGGFGAFGNPSSFHSPTVRAVRQVVLPVARKVFAQAYPQPAARALVLEQLLDRVCLRTPGTKIPAESWHRDITPPQVKLPRPDGTVEKEPTDLPSAQVFGGWVNLNKAGGEDQQFIFVPETHKEDPTESQLKGFEPILKEDQPALDKRCQTLTVPPGHLIIFFQHIAHKVAPTKYKSPSLRLFIGWRVGGPESHFFGNEYMNRVLSNFEASALPSGQRPPLYSANCLSIRNAKTIAWSRRALKSSLLVQKIPTKKSGKDPYTIAPRFLTSLVPKFRERFPRFFTPYSAAQLRALKPQLLQL